MPSQTSGSVWSSGFLARKCLELPLHFIQGMCGCAFSILLKTFLEKGVEVSEDLLAYIGKSRCS